MPDAYSAPCSAVSNSAPGDVCDPHLEHVVIDGTDGEHNLLRDRHRVRQVLVEKLMQLLSVICTHSRGPNQFTLPTPDHARISQDHEAWPLDCGPMSRNESLPADEGD